MLGNEEVQGIYILAASEIFTKLHNETHGKGLGLWISFYEIYCGQLFDLLNGRAKYVCFGHAKKYNIVYIGDLKKNDLCGICVYYSTCTCLFTWEDLNIQDQQKLDQINPCNLMPAATFVI